jgi:hypothetical protein
MSGEKYNKQIEVISTEDEEVYKFIIPSEMQGLNGLQINLGYSPTNAEDFKFMKESQRLDFTNVGDNAIGTFTVVKKEKRLPFLHVIWWPGGLGLCGIAASSDFIGVSNT